MGIISVFGLNDKLWEAPSLLGAPTSSRHLDDDQDADWKSALAVIRAFDAWLSPPLCPIF
jgi:hypothetical protein